MDSGSLKSVVKLYSLKKLHVTIAFACWNCTMQALHRFPHDLFPSWHSWHVKMPQMSSNKYANIVFTIVYVCNLVYCGYYYLCHSPFSNSLSYCYTIESEGSMACFFFIILIDNETMKLVWNFINDFSPRSHHLQLRIPCNFWGSDSLHGLHSSIVNKFVKLSLINIGRREALRWISSSVYYP